MVDMALFSSVLLFILGIQHSHSTQDLANIFDVAKNGLSIYPHDAFIMEKGLEVPEDLELLRKLMKKVKKQSKRKNKKRRANKVRRKRFSVDDTINPQSVWPEGKVNYQMSSALDQTAQARILYVMQMYSQYSPVRFFESSNKTYLNFIKSGYRCHDNSISRKKGPFHTWDDKNPEIFMGCWSYIGRVHSFTDQSISCCTHQTWDQRYCNHELGHALGLFHEHQNKYGSDFFRKNDMAIGDNMKPWFRLLHGNKRYYDHKLDLDSPMGYANTDFSISSSLLKSITVFDDKYDIILGNYGDRQLLYYLYKEINELYGVDTICPGFTCEFDGYTALENDVCGCECPTGLSSLATPGCTEIEVEGWKVGVHMYKMYDLGSDNKALEENQGQLLKCTSNPTYIEFGYESNKCTGGDDLEWPENVFLIKINSQIPCPYGFTSDHWMEMIGGPHAVEYDNIFNFDADISSPANNDTIMKIGFCYRNSGSSSTTWPKGSYCINPQNGTCPTGFYEGIKKFNNGGSFSTNGLPGGITVNGIQTSIKFCCRNDSHFSMPAVFPRNDDFILWPLTGQCQEVDGMHSTFQFVKYHNNEDQSDVNPAGLVPRMDIREGNITLYLCHYIKRTTNCGGTYTINSTNREVTFTTPNFPDDYPDRYRCTWAFRTDPGKKLRLVFHHFDIAMNPDGTADDEVEVREIKIGNWGPRYTGFGRLREHISVENYLSVVLYSNENNTAKGLNATVSLVDDTVLCYSGRGENYDGKRSITKNFKQCLDWTTAAEKGAPHHPFTFSNLQDSLLGNYCRFPKDGLAPWCYVDFNGGFKREYCDVCNLQGCFDNDLGDCSANLTLERFCVINNNADLCQATCSCEDPSSTSCPYNDSRSDCQDAVDSLQPFYDSKESVRYCARSAGYCDKMEAEPLKRTCKPPEEDLSNLIDAKSSYNLGDVIRFSCPNSSKTSNRTCSSTGKWIINSLCELVTSCPDDYEMIGDNCYKLIQEVSHAEGKDLCEADNAKMLMMKSQESQTLIDALMSVFPSISTAWIDLQDVDDSDQFMWGDGTLLTFTKWMTKPFVAPSECRIIDGNSRTVYSTRSVSKYGKQCLSWALEEVVNASGVNYIFDNYCTSFTLGTPDLYCYVNDSGDIVQESCGVIPFCYDESIPLQREPIPRVSNITYQGNQRFAKNHQKCMKWVDVVESYFNLTDADFIDGSKEAANDYCRSPNKIFLTDTGQPYTIPELWCFISTTGSMEYCNDEPTPCSKTDCYTTRKNIDGTVNRLLSWKRQNTEDGRLCIPWKSMGHTYYSDDFRFPFDGDSVDNAASYCRPLYDPYPWCFTSINWHWGYCDSALDCCAEEGYERPYYYNGNRDYAWNNEKCMKWIDVVDLPYTDDSFPDGSIALAQDYCRAPDNGDYLFCYVFNGKTKVAEKRWCDVPMEKNIKDCVYYDRDEEMWKPKYCDDLHDVICEKPVTVPACKDTNKAKCLELFEARPEECKSNSSFFGEDMCRQTCGLCTEEIPEPNTDECSEPVLKADIIKVTTSTTVQVGYFFEYTCPAGKIAKGNLKRGCLPDLNLTGENPSCIDQSEVDEWVNNSTMRERRFLEPGKILIFIQNNKNIIQKNGYLKAWSYFSQSNTDLAFYVLRLNATDNNFTIVNYTKISHVQSFRATTLQLPVMNQFPVQQGDYIGWVLLDSNDGGIPYDTCNGNVNPDDYGQRRNVTSVTDYTLPANQTSFKPGTENICRRYSLTALIGPRG